VQGRDPLTGLEKIWGELAELEERQKDAQARVEREISRLARNKHRARALRQLYWDSLERVPVMILAQLFNIDVKNMAIAAGAQLEKTTCNLCSLEFELELKNRSARRELEREISHRTKNPKHAICTHCLAFRKVDLELLRKQKGQRLDALHYAAYLEYLNTPQWRERRVRALKRAKNRCQLCSQKGRLNVHHRTYERLGSERPEDLTVLCENCHSSHHGH